MISLQLVRRRNLWLRRCKARVVDCSILALCRALSVSADTLLGGVPDKGERVAPELMEAVRSNLKRRLMTIGWVTALTGVVLLIADFFALYLIQFKAMQLEMEHHGAVGFFADPMAYAAIPPMPAVFAVTGVILIAGVGLMIAGALYGVRRRGQ